MKTVISVGITLALMLSVVPAMAGDMDTFQAFSKMAVGGEQERLTPLSDEQLATIEGSDFCSRCAQFATTFNALDFDQANVNVSSRSDVYQSNSARVYQRATTSQSIN